MIVRILCFLFAVLLTANICNAGVPSSNSNEQAARAFLKEASTKFFEYNDNLAQKQFQMYEDDSDEEAANATYKNFFAKAKLTVEIFEDSKKFDQSKFTDPELKYVFENFKKSPGVFILGEENLSKILQSLTLLEELASDKDIPSYHNKSIDLAFFPDIQEIFAKSNDPAELKYYWKTWRDKNGAWATSYFVKLIKLLKEAAKLNEITPLQLWLDEYNITEMENVMTQMEPFYLQLHGFIRNQLLKKYGDLVIKPKKPIPHHLFEQVLAQTWTSGSIIDDKYPHKDLPPYDEILKQNNYDTLKMFKMADGFYRSMGFNSISEEYWTNHIKMNSNEDEGDCKAMVFDESPNVYLRYCQKMDFRKFLQAHGYMGEVYYAREKIDLPAYYFDSYGLEYPVGEAVILSASTPKHLSSIGLVTQFRFTDEVKMNRLLRMGIHTLLNARVYFVHSKVMADLFAGIVDITDLNKRYWKLMEKYVGVAPPNNRGPDAYDFPFKFYTSLSANGNEQASKFMGEVLGYQIYEKLCEISGQYSKSKESEPINNCDFYGSEKAGEALKKMMRLGSSKPMREVLATIFPENPTVNADSLIKYYTPMKNWLIERNREDNVSVGWRHSKKKISIVTNYDDEELVPLK
ncbi:angiotensin-converting enzyme-like [Eupeodes corollae]|uniref:angiotensin-converting enzyme-like n=1 Tax=Eupeodes corollae TaxID=290404 RepID=UPI002491087E|nr:angiotensin-converting enzyme-like [Eupeodes corollae]